MMCGRGKVGKRWHSALILTVIITVLLLGSCINANAEETQKDLDVYGEIDKIVEDFKHILPEGYGDKANVGNAAESLGIKHILESIVAEMSGRGGEAITLLLTLIGVALIGSLASLHATDMGAFSSRAVGCVCAALLFDRLTFLISGAVESLNEIGDFFSAVIPVCLAVNSLGTSPTTATTQAIGMGVTLGIYSHLSSSVILPLVCAVYVSSAASSVDAIFGRIARGVRGIFLWVMGIFTALVGATFSLQSVISSSADSAVIRGARYALSGTVPIVGGAVSGALGVLTSGVAYARGIVGGGAIAVMLSLVISPLVTLLLYRACLKAGILFSSVISSDGSGAVLSSFLSALDVLIAAYTLTVTVYTVELVAFLKGGVAFA